MLPGEAGSQTPSQGYWHLGWGGESPENQEGLETPTMLHQYAGRKGRVSVDFVLSDDTVLVAASSSSSPRPVLLCLPLSQSIYK